MSQIQWRVRHDEWGNVDVHAGWDRVTQSYHWTVLGPEDEVLTQDSIDSGITARGVMKQLERCGVETPEGLEETLVAHREQNVGNVVVRMTLEKEERGRRDEPAPQEEGGVA